ncbi:MAG TPA: hypothetical protein VGM03_23550 [Phycisphaerae bacterium]|jgi:type II secretory pathway pseudopilin PulG
MDMRRPRRGVIFAEVVAALALLTLMAALATSAVSRYQQARDHYAWHQAALWAADAQLRRYQAGAEIDSPPPAGTIAVYVSLHTVVEPGRGAWTGLDRITVTATITGPRQRMIQESTVGFVRRRPPT